MRLSERALQLLQLLKRERGPVPPLFPPHKRVVVYRRMVGVARICEQSNDGYCFSLNFGEDVSFRAERETSEIIT